MITRGRIRNVILGAAAAAAGAILIVISKPPTSPVGTCSSVAIRSVTYTFNTALPCGTFVNGDPWVVVAAGDTSKTLTGMTPAYTSSPGRNGWQVNPTDAANQGYDDRITSGGCCYNAALVPSLPFTLAPNQSIIKSISEPATCVTGNVPCLTDAEILTVLGSVPANPAQTFRPSEYGTIKRIFTTAGMQTSLLPSLAPVTGTPTLSTMEARMIRPQLDPLNNFLDRFTHPSKTYYDYTNPASDDAYGAEAAKDWNDAMLRTMLNDSLSSKQNLINYIVQAGIDEYGWRKVPHTWSADGGHYVGRKALVAYAGLMLNDSDMQSIAGDTGWDENAHVQFSTAAGVSGRVYFNDQGGAGMPLFGKTCSAGTYQNNQNNQNVGAKDCRDDLGPGGASLIDGGFDPADTYNWCCTVGVYRAERLIQSLVPGLASIYNFSRFNNFVDRMFTYGTWTSPDSVAPRSPSGGYLADAGTAGAITNGSSTFGQNMWNTYKPTTTFCGTGGCTLRTGASTAVCVSPNPCTTNTTPVATNVSLGNIDNDTGTLEARKINFIYKPNGLTTSTTNKPLVILELDCSPQDTPRWNSLSAAHKFIYAEMGCASGRNAWDKKWVGSLAGDPAATPDDEPAIRAAITYLTTCPGAAWQCGDPSDVWVTGASSAGAMSLDAICDPITAPMLRGAIVVSSGFNIRTSPSNTPSCPSTYQGNFPLMIGGEVNQDIGLWGATATSATQINTAGNYFYTPYGFTQFWGNKNGCAASVVTSTYLSIHRRADVAGPCAIAASGTSAAAGLGIKNGGHSACQQDSDPGYPGPGCSGPAFATNGNFDSLDGITFIEQTKW